MTACPVWPWLSPYNVCVTFAPPWSLADLTGSHDDSSLLPIDQGRWWGLPLVSMLTANISGAALKVKNLQSKKCKSVNWKTNCDSHRSNGLKQRLVYVSLNTALSSIWSNGILTATYVDASFLFVLQGSEVLKEHHCPFVYAANPSQCDVSK